MPSPTPLDVRIARIMAVVGVVVSGLVFLPEHSIRGTYVVGLFWFITLTALWILLFRSLAAALQPSVRYRGLRLLFLTGCGLALYTQFYLGLMTTPFSMFWFTVPITVSWTFVVVGVIAGIWLACAVWLRKSITHALALLLLAVFLAATGRPTATLAESLLARQRAVNDRNGEKIAGAVRRFHEDHGVYPSSLSELKPRYIRSVPWWWHGFLKRPYMYWRREDFDGSQPFLKFCSEVGGGRFYDFERRKWETEVL